MIIPALRTLVVALSAVAVTPSAVPAETAPDAGTGPSASAAVAAPPAPPAPPESAAGGPFADLPLIDAETWRRWWIDPTANHATFDQGDLVVHTGVSGACGLHAEIGDASWDDYQVSGEYRCDADHGPPSGMPWNVQIAPHACRIFVQVLAGAVLKTAYWPFQEVAHADLAPAQAAPGWHALTVTVLQGGVLQAIDGQVVTAAVVPGGTGGRLGLLVDFASTATVRLRHLRITFLRPTAAQVRAYLATTQPPPPPPAPAEAHRSSSGGTTPGF
jgi:hypothetical protein